MTTSRLVLVVVVAVTAAAGCPPAISTTCDNGDDCPEGYRCDLSRGVCVQTAAVVDATAIDAASNDAAALDAARVDVGAVDRSAIDAPVADASAADASAPDLPTRDQRVADSNAPDKSEPDISRPDTAQPDRRPPIDSDGDGVSDVDELLGQPHGFVTDPRNPDSDGDGYSDLDDPLPTIARCHSALLYRQDFDADPADWIDVSGAWQRSVDGYRMAQPVGGAKTWIGPRTWTDYVYQVRLRPDADNNDVGILFRATTVEAGANAGLHYYVGIYPASDGVVLGLMNGGWNPIISGTYPIAPGQWYLMQVIVSGTTFEVTIDGASVLTATNNAIPSGSIGFRTYQGLATYDDVVVCQ